MSIVAMFAAFAVLVVMAIQSVSNTTSDPAEQRSARMDTARIDAEPSRRTVTRWTPDEIKDDSVQGQLVEAAGRGDEELVLKLLDQGASPHAADANGAFPLHRAAKEGRMDTVALLISRGAELNEGDVVGYSALAWASTNGHADTVRILLEAGADPNLQFPPGRSTALHTVLLGWLVAAEILPKPPDADVAVNSDKRTEIVRMLLTHGADPNLVGTSGTHSSELGAMTGDADLVRLLLENGAEAVDTELLNHFTHIPGEVSDLLKEAAEARR